MANQGWRMEYRNDLDISIAIRWIVTKLGNFYIDIENVDEVSIQEIHEKQWSIIEPHDYDLVELQPE